MLRQLMFLVLGLVMTSALIVRNASAQTVVFECQKNLDISGDPAAPEWIKLGMTVVESAGIFTSTLEGASDPLPQATVVQELSLQNALQVVGVSHVLTETKLDPVQRAAIDKVKIFTTGNFEDDAAGVRAAEFFDVKGLSLAKGMFFGWGGPHKCE